MGQKNDELHQLYEFGRQVDPRPETTYASIQHKGSDLCMDVHCECGHHGHIDDHFCHYYQCVKCQKVYMVGAVLKLMPLCDDLVHYVLQELDGLVKRDDSNPRFHGNDDLDCARRGLGTQRFAVVSEGDAKFYSTVLTIAVDHYLEKHAWYKARAAEARRRDRTAKGEEYIDLAAEAETMRRKAKAELDRLMKDMATTTKE